MKNKSYNEQTLIIVVSIIIILSSFSCKKTDSKSSKAAVSIDSLVNESTDKPFNGIILIAKGKEPVFFQMYGYEEIEEGKIIK